MQDHLDRDALERLVHRRCHASRAYGWLLHLLACTECRERVVRTYPGKGERFLREIFRTQEPLRPPDLEDQDRLDRVLEDLQTHGLLEYMQEGDVPTLLADLHRHPPQRQRLILDNTERLWNLGTVEYLLERSEGEIFRDPPCGQLQADLALSVLDRLSPSRYHPRLLYDLRGRAVGLRANFLRICEQYASAEQDFNLAATLLDSGTGDIDESIRLVAFRGCLAACQRRFWQSIGFHERALRMSRVSGNRKTELNAVVSLVSQLPAVGRTKEAIELGEFYLEQVSLDRDGPQTIVLLQGNLALALSVAGQSLPAHRLHQEVVHTALMQEPRIRTKTYWQRVLILESLGDFDEAEAVARAVANRVLAHWGPSCYGSLLKDRARLALRRRDHFLAQKYGRDAWQILEESGRLNLAQATRRMLAGGPFVYY